MWFRCGKKKHCSVKATRKLLSHLAGDHSHLTSDQSIVHSLKYKFNGGVNVQFGLNLTICIFDNHRGATQDDSIAEVIQVWKRKSLFGQSDAKAFVSLNR